jgi:peptide deformylase
MTRLRARIEIGVELEIVQTGNLVLRQQARPLGFAEITSKEIQKLIESMRKTMHDAPGVGLAAPQVGLSLQLVVVEDREEYHKDVSVEQLQERERRPVPFHAIINPRIVETSGGTAEFFEGCLSLSGFSALVPRARAVRVECLNERGKKKVIEASGWYARILQHEIDHLRGTLYIDRMHARTFTSLDNWNQFWKSKAISEIKAAFDLEQE